MHITLGGAFPKRHRADGGVIATIRKVAIFGVSHQPLARLRLLFGLLEALFNIWIFGFYFVQFREYFLYNFSKTKK
jgi:hypothetical protein